MGGKTLVDTKVIEGHSQLVYVGVALAVDHAVLLGPPLDEDVYDLIVIGDGDGGYIALDLDLDIVSFNETCPKLTAFVDEDEWVVRLVAYAADVLACGIEVL